MQTLKQLLGGVHASSNLVYHSQSSLVYTLQCNASVLLWHRYRHAVLRSMNNKRCLTGPAGRAVVGISPWASKTAHMRPYPLQSHAKMRTFSHPTSKAAASHSFICYTSCDNKLCHSSCSNFSLSPPTEHPVRAEGGQAPQKQHSQPLF